MAVCGGGRGVVWCRKADETNTKKSISRRGLGHDHPPAGKQRAVEQKAKGLWPRQPTQLQAKLPKLVHEACVGVLVGCGWTDARDTRTTKRREGLVQSLG